MWCLLLLSFPIDYPLVSPSLSFHLHELQKTAVLSFVHHHHDVREGLGVFPVDPQDEVGPSISSSVVLCSFVLLVYIVVLVLVVCLCPSSVRVVATFSGTVVFPLLCSVLPFFA